MAHSLIGRALRAILPRYFPDPEVDRKPFAEVLSWFANGGRLTLHHDLSDADYAKALDDVAGLRALVARDVPNLFLAGRLASFSQVRRRAAPAPAAPPRRTPTHARRMWCSARSAS